MPATTSALTRDRAMDLYFMEHRAKLIDLAAFLDRLDRARRVLELFSDPTTEPIAKAPMKGALGTYQKS